MPERVLHVQAHKARESRSKINAHQIKACMDIPWAGVVEKDTVADYGKVRSGFMHFLDLHRVISRPASSC